MHTTTARKFKRPSLVWLAIKWLPFIIGALALSLIPLLLLSGCAAPSLPITNHAPAVTLTTAERDALFYHWPAPALRIVPVSADWHPVTLAWYQPGTCAGWVIEESTNLTTWQAVATRWNEYVRHDSQETNTVYTAASPGFYRVASFNGQ